MIGFDDTITKLFNLRHPIIQGGMVWVSGAKLASAVANSGCLGLIGAGSMKPDLLKTHIQKAQSLLTSEEARLGVNVPLLYEGAQEQIETALALGIKTFFLSAGSPKKFTSYLHDQGALVAHVTSSPDLAIKCENAGVDAIVAEGFEAGGHNGRDESTTMTLIPQVCDAVSIPVIAAGGIVDGRQMAAAACLGAHGVQIGTAFAATRESSAHPRFKEKIIASRLGSTHLRMKKHVPVRLLDNDFAQEVALKESMGASKEELVELLGKGRAKRGMLDGDVDQGELEIGQGAAMIDAVVSVEEYVAKLTSDYSALVTP